MQKRNYFLLEKKCVRKKSTIIIIKVRKSCTGKFNDREFNERENN